MDSDSEFPNIPIVHWECMPRPQMMAISVIKGMFQSQSLSQLTEPLQPEDLENLAPILKTMISGSCTIPSFILKLFQTTLDNMFGELKMDFDLLNNDYLYVKSVFVDNGAANNSSIRFERIMKLIQHAKITTLQIRNVHLTQDSFDNIVNYLANDDNHDQENCLQNAVKYSQCTQTNSRHVAGKCIMNRKQLKSSFD